MSFLDLFSNPSIKVDVCKTIMQHFSRNATEETTFTDLVRVNGIMYITKTLHDSINALTFEDEKRQIGELIMAFIKKVFMLRLCCTNFFFFLVIMAGRLWQRL